MTDSAPETIEEALECWIRQAEEYNGKHQAACLEIERLRRALEKIAAMDPLGVRADDLARASRIARDAVSSQKEPS